MAYTPHEHRREWLIRIVWHEDLHHPQMLMRPADQGEDAPWQEFTDQDVFLRHLWRLIEGQAGLR